MQQIKSDLVKIGTTLLGLCIIFSQCTFSNQDKIDFNTQIKPILNKKCISCHGGVKESGGFSLMTREKALAITDAGHAAIVPGNVSGSEFIKRLKYEDEELRMPLEGPALAQEEINLLEKWVEEGANWGVHWAYRPVAKVVVPKVEKALGAVGEVNTEDTWAVNNIDYFVLKKLAKKGLSPNQIADKRAILRRLSLDLTGLPAPENLSKQFLDKSNQFTYEQLVDSLLASPHFGERWASMWLDLARYADSKGFERDANRSIYAYRDYLIKAFNKDLPYDQFITEQLAGDLLPNPSDDQFIATGFHRNTTTNDEGGTDNEEFRVAAVVDRVNTTGEVLLGSTFACIQCHSHPYDPFDHKEYYQMMAFFNNTRDMDTHKDYPLLRIYEPTDKEKLTALTNWIGKVESKEYAEEIRLFLKTWQPTVYSIDTDNLINAAFYDTKYLGFRQNGQARMKNITLTGKNKLLVRGYMPLKGGRFTIRLDSDKGKIIADYQLPYFKKGGYQYLEIPLEPTTGKHHLYLQYENPNLKNPDKMGFQIDWFYFTKDFPGATDPEYDKNEQYFWDLMNAQPTTTLITMENAMARSRTTRVFDRGSWQTLKDMVNPEVPKILNPFPENAPKNRLGLAQWMTRPENPLTARTMVNRLWGQLFGQGLVETIEDLGTQGAKPTHPELLDWLAYQYMNEFNWSTKQLLKEIVLSATYRQSTKATEEKLAQDPYNTLFTRGPRVRLSAEQIRDQTLTVSGLLNRKMYGKPVMPYQPEGLWSTPYNEQSWQQSEGKDKYRRAIYTFMKRSSPYPSMETFDVSPRQVCASRRIRTNTPLQALVTLNDPVFVEAAKHFAWRMQQTNTDLSEQIKNGYEIAIGQPIQQEKLAVLETLYVNALKEFQLDPNANKAILSDLSIEKKSTETAAMAIVANAILNLDEFMMK